MRYYKFNRDRSLDPLQKCRKSTRKLGYLASRNKLRLLDSFYFENQTWGALHKAWKGYVIAKDKGEPDKLEYYAGVIQKLQKELGLEISSFPDLNMLGTDILGNNSEHSNDDEITEADIEEYMRRDMENLRSYRNENMEQDQQ